ASTLLINTKPTGNGHYLLTSVTDDCAYLQTDAEKGLKIIQGGDTSSLVDKMGSNTPTATFDKTGQVGIGTEEPRSKLDITDGKSGSIRADFSQDNVCISTINERQSNTYAAMGVDDDFATLITDTPYGFVFKSGEPYGDGSLNNEVNINQGDKVAYISPEGRMGLRTINVPEDYDLDVNGQIRSLIAFLHTDSSTIQNAKELKDENTLEKVCELKPIRFKFKPNTNVSEEEERIGFNASNVFEHFPELISKSGNQKSIAYANMTAVLVQAIKEQQAIIEDLNQRLCDLEEQAGNGD
ncbi:MAG: tail fiber domain-containing protein, partial [Bacteroidota bacterium]